MTPAGPLPPRRSPAEIEAENASVLHAIGVKTYQVKTLEREIAGLVKRVDALNAEHTAAKAAAKESP